MSNHHSEERGPSEQLVRSGVLTKADILREATAVQPMIKPFDCKLLRPAAYTLRVGDRYSQNGKRQTLAAGDSITIPPYDVVVVQTHESLNLPTWLIARWNLKTKKVYQGLLWVGGAQVDPGFVGHLCCPIYNLSADPVKLGFLDEIATIDFVTTTAEAVPWGKPEKPFDEYPTFKSGVAGKLTDFDDSIQGFKTGINESAKQQSSFVLLVFAVLAVLFAALGVVATKGSIDASIWSTPVWLSAGAIYLALRALAGGPIGAGAGIERKGRQWVAEALVIVGLIGVSLWYGRGTRNLTAAEIRSAADAARRLDEINAASSRIDTLQQQVDSLAHDVGSLRSQPARTH